MRNSLGIDIGNRYTKVVELEPQPQIKNAIIFKTPYLSGGQAGGKRIDAASFWQEITRQIPLERIKTSQIAINIPSNLITALTLFLPRAGRKELMVMAQTEARRKMIPASGPKHIFEISLIGQRITAKISRFEVLVVRSDKLYVQQTLDLFKNAQSTPATITLSGSTLFTVSAEETLNRKDTDTAFIDIGLDINTSIFREGKLSFFRNTAFGLRDIIQDIAKRLLLSEEEAEAIIKEKGIPEVNFDLKDKVAVAEAIMQQKYEASLKAQETHKKEEVNLLELRTLWQAHIERIIHELRRSLSYYKEQSEGRRVDYIYFLGGGCQIENLINHLTEQIGGQCQILAPLNSTPIFVNAVSLALSIIGKARAPAIINFLPREIKRKEIIAARRVILLASQLVSIIIVASLLTSVFFNNRALNISIKGMDFELNRMKRVVERLKDLKEREEKVQRESSQIQEIVKKRENFALPLKALTKVIPEKVLLTQILIHKGNGIETQTLALNAAEFTPQAQYKIEIKAGVFSDYEEANKIIASLRSRLEGTPYFKNVNTTSIELEKVSSLSTTGQAQGLRLTQPRLRTFSLTADLVATNK